MTTFCAASGRANVIYVLYDGPWLRTLGELVTTCVGLIVLARVWQVFPFDFSGYSVRWSVLVRLVLVIAIAGSIIGIIVQFLSLVRLAVDGDARAGRRGAVGR